jgi:hypothetical protein
MMPGGGAECQLKVLIEIVAPFTTTMSFIGPHSNWGRLLLSAPELLPKKKEVAHVKL